MSQTISTMVDVSAGQTEAGDIVVSGGSLEDWGTVTGTQVQSNGLLQVMGVASTTTVTSYGHVDVYGSAFDIIDTGYWAHDCVWGTQYPPYGPGSASGTVISAGGYEIVYSGGLSVSATVNSGCNQYLSAGTASGTKVFSGGYQDVYFGGSAVSTTIIGGTEYVAAGGTASGAIISSGGTLQLDNGAIAVSGAVVFSGTNEFPGSITIYDISAGVMSIGGTSMPTAPISGFCLGDDIDLTDVNCESEPISCTVSQGGLKLLSVGNLNLSVTDAVSNGPDPIPTIGLKPDGNGGTDIETTPLQALYDLSFDTYNYTTPPASGAAGKDGYTVIASTSDRGFEAIAYEYGSGTNDPSIVIAFRGTQLNTIPSAIKNVLADTSFTAGYPNAILQQYVSDAADFVQTVALSTQSEDPLITLTGHSLGGALAQLVGKASGFATAAFDAPGSGQLYLQLTSELSPASGLGYGGTNIDYCLCGDQVSMAGQPIAQTFTLPSPYGTTSSSGIIDVMVNNILNNHGMGPQGFGDLQSATYTAGLTGPNFIGGTQSALQTPLGAPLNFVFNVLAGTAIALDPVSGTGFTFTESAGSPDFASIELPLDPGVADYEFSEEVGTSWSAPELVLPGVDITVSSGVDGVAFDPVGSSGQPVAMSDGFSLGATFVTGGTVSGTMTVSGEQPDGQPITTSGSLTVLQNSAATAISIAMPTDAAYPNAAELAVSVISLPSNGAVFLSDGKTPVTVGEELTTAQLTTLLFEPTSGLSGDSSTFTYDVADPDFASTSGMEALTIVASNHVVSGGQTLTISGGQTSSGFFVLDGGTEYVKSGGTASGTVLSISGNLYVSSGGVTSGTTVSSGGLEVVLWGGSAGGTTIDGGGQQTVGSGGSASGTMVWAGGEEYVVFGGAVSGTQIDGGVEALYGSATSTTINSGGELGVDSGGVASGSIVSSDGTQVVSSGGVAIRTTVSNSGFDKVSSGGVDSATTIGAGGSEYVSTDGVAVGTTISGGLLDLQTGGSATTAITFAGTGGKLEIDGATMPTATISGLTSGDTIDLTGVSFVSSGSGTLLAGNELQIVEGATTKDLYLNSDQNLSGGTFLLASDGSGGTAVTLGAGITITLSSGTVTVSTALPGTSSYVVAGSGTLNVVSGGMVTGTTVSSGGALTVGSGGTASGSIVSSGGVEYIAWGGSATGTVISGGIEYDFGVDGKATLNSGGDQVVESGGSVSGTIVSSGSVEYIASGGTATGTIVGGGGIEYDFGVDGKVTVNSGGDQFVESGGSVSGSIVSSGSVEYIASGGSASGTTVSSGGAEYIVTGGAVSATHINGGFDILYGGSAISTTVSSGGEQVVESGGSANGTIVSSGGWEYVVAGGAASATQLNGGIDVFWGSVNGTTINSGGEQVIEAGGSASGTIVSSGGWEYVVGVASATQLDGGIDVLFGSVNGTTINSGGEQVVESGGSASGTIVSSGGSEYVVAGGAVSATQLNGGVDVLFGSANGTTINSGGEQVVESGGSARGTVVSSGGGEYVLSGGAVSATQLDGGTDVLYGSATSTTIHNGGVQVVDAGGAASGTIVSSGGLEYVASGGTATATVISGGTIELTSGASTGSAAITFASGAGGTLRFDDSVHFGGLVAGFGLQDQLDLSDISFVSGTTSVSFTEASNNTSGTLTVTEGAQTAKITLLGQYVAGNFSIQSDGHGGTTVTDPPVIASAEQPLLAQPQHA